MFVVNQKYWKQHRYDIVFRTNFCKFSQNPGLQRALEATGEKHIAEASRHDLWGIGYWADHPFASERARCGGQNLLSRVLMDVRERLHSSLHVKSALPPCSAKPTPTLTDSSRVIPTADGTHETSPSPPQRTPGTPLGLLLPPFTPNALPSSHFAEISTVDGADNLYLAITAPTIPEHEP